MLHKVKPQIWKWHLQPCVIVAEMRARALTYMLRDMWCAAAIEVAKEYRG